MEQDQEIKKLFEAAHKLEMPEVAKRHIKMSILQSNLNPTPKSRLSIYFRYAMVPALIAVLFIGGGVSYAAEGTIPGDALYPVKTNINEKVAGFFALSPESKADWQGKLALRRLAEVERIAERRGVNVEVVLDQHFAEQADRFANRLEDLKKTASHEDIERIENKFTLAINKRKEVLEKVYTGSITPTSTKRVINRLAFLELSVQPSNPVLSSAPANEPVFAAALSEQSEVDTKHVGSGIDIELNIEENYKPDAVLDLSVMLVNNTREEYVLVFNNGCKEVRVLVNGKASGVQSDMFCIQVITEIPIAAGGTYEHEFSIDLADFETADGENTLTLEFPGGVTESFSFNIHK